MTTIIDGSAGITFPSGGNPQDAPASVIQVVGATYSTQVSTTSSTYVTTGLSASITPKFSTSKILILINGNLYISSSSSQSNLTLYRNSTNINGTYGFFQCNSSGVTFSGGANYLDSPATTSSTSYTVYYNYIGSGGSAFFNIQSLSTTITLMEIAA